MDFYGHSCHFLASEEHNGIWNYYKVQIDSGKYCMLLPVILNISSLSFPGSIQLSFQSTTSGLMINIYLYPVFGIAKRFQISILSRDFNRIFHIQNLRSIVPRREFSLPQKQFNLPLDFHRYFSSIQIQNIRSVVPHTKFSLPQKEFSLPLYRDSKIFKEVSTVF